MHPNEVARRVLGLFYEIYTSRGGDLTTWSLEYGSSEFATRGLEAKQVRGAFDRLCESGWAKRVGQDGATLTLRGAEAWEHPWQVDSRLRLPAQIEARRQPKQEKAVSTGGIRIFVSHSSEDKELAKSLIQLIEAGLEAPRGTIRCTSVDGYKLDGGDDAPEVLRANLRECDVVLAMLTRASVSSSYVVMELGAAWALAKRAIPLIGHGVTFGDLPGPFKDIHALRMDHDADMGGLIETIGKCTSLPQTSDMPKILAALATFKKALTVSRASEVAPSTLFRESATPDVPVQVTLGYEPIEQTNEFHKGHFVATIRNVGKKELTNWSVQLDVPAPLVTPSQIGSFVPNMSDAKRAVFRPSKTFVDEHHLWPGQTYAFKILYLIGEATQGLRTADVRATAYAGGELLAEATKSVGDLTSFFAAAFVAQREALREMKDSADRSASELAASLVPKR
jgi:hypothetical protein